MRICCKKILELSYTISDTMSIIRSKYLGNHFRDNSDNEASNKTINKLIQFSSLEPNPEDCMKNGIEEEDTIFMVKAPFAGHITILHHITKIGGIRRARNKTILALIGTSEETYPALTDEKTLFKPFELKTLS